MPTAVILGGARAGSMLVFALLVPLARLERARLATIDFESIASTIPPQGHT